jgi:hypothetical protein
MLQVASNRACRLVSAGGPLLFPIPENRRLDLLVQSPAPDGDGTFLKRHSLVATHRGG